MSLNRSVKSDEELVAIVKEYMERHPNATRNTVILNSHGNHRRVRELDKKGLIKLPPPQKQGDAWRRNFHYKSDNEMYA